LRTEEIIKETAKEVFFSKGLLHATTQEIADAAQVNRSLINYHFGSRDLLFQTVYREAVDSLKAKIDEVVYSELDFRAKIERFIDVYMAEILRFPYRESFLITEICSDSFALTEKKKSDALVYFLTEIEQAMNIGLIPKTNPIQFLINFFALMAFPVIMRPLYQKLMDIESTQYDQLIKERKQLIINQIFIQH
jgi:AcrR family transcriptional regulator